MFKTLSRAVKCRAVLCGPVQLFAAVRSVRAVTSLVAPGPPSIFVSCNQCTSRTLFPPTARPRFQEAELRRNQVARAGQGWQGWVDTRGQYQLVVQSALPACTQHPVQAR
jgi:hypothetical protein